jgi:hypothetical protein
VRYQVFLLPAGGFFEGFGGSRSGLLVGKTPSMIVRTFDGVGQRDVRTHGPVNINGNGKVRPAYSSVGLNIGDIDALCRELQALKTQLVYEPGQE